MPNIILKPASIYVPTFAECVAILRGAGRVRAASTAPGGGGGASYPNEPSGMTPLLYSSLSPKKGYVCDFDSVITRAQWPWTDLPAHAQNYPETLAQPWIDIGYCTDTAGGGDPPCEPATPYGSSGGACYSMCERTATVADGTAPVNPSAVGRVEFSHTTGYGIGGNNNHSPITIRSYDIMVPPSNWAQIYISWWFKLSSNYRLLQNLFQHKHWTFKGNAGGNSGLNACHSWSGDDAGPFKLNLYAGGDGSNSTEIYSADTPIYTGTWYQYEARLTKATRRVELFLNGTVRMDDFLATEHFPAGFIEFWWVWNTGGGMDYSDYNPPLVDASSAFYFYNDDWYMSYK